MVGLLLGANSALMSSQCKLASEEGKMKMKIFTA
jgi:hypothetical protein